VSLELGDRKILARRLRKAFRLAASEWTLLVQAAGWFAVVELGLRLVPVQSLLNFLGRGAAPEITASSLSPERVGRLVDAASRVYPLRATCLKKALVVYALLGRRGFKVKLLLGAAKQDGKLDCHAWLEHQGRVVVGGSGSERYSLLWSADHSIAVTAQRERQASA